MVAQALAESFPFDGAPLYADDYRALASAELLPGVLRGELNRLAVSSTGTMILDVATGLAWVGGIYCENTSIKTVTLDASDALLPRIDRVVVVADFTAKTVAVDKVTGVPDAVPVATALVQNTERYEMPLALVAVAAGATGPTAGDITDDRRWTVSAHGAGGLEAALSVAADITGSVSSLEQAWASWSLSAVLRLGRRYRFAMGAWMSNAGGVATMDHRIRDGELAGPLVLQWMGVPSGSAGDVVRLIGIRDCSAAGADLGEGLHTFVLTVTSASSAPTLYGATSAAVANAINHPPWLTIEDIGPS